MSNNINWGKIYESTAWGNTDNNISWGSAYADLAGGGGFTGLLDTYSGAAAAYSLRQLSSTYSGNAIKVRRASDNAEQDIAFSNNELDTATLETFASGTDAFVTTWYDQSGNGNDAAQGTASSQPKIVSSGSTILDNGKAAVQFDGSDDNLPFTQIQSTAGMYLTAVANFNNITGGTNPYQPVTIIGEENGGLVQDVALGARTGSASLYFETGIQNEVKSAAILVNTQYLLTGFVDSSTSFISVNGTQTNGSAGRNDHLIQVIGGEGLYAIPRMNGEVQEILVYTTDVTANKSGIETNINDFYSIY